MVGLAAGLAAISMGGGFIAGIVLLPAMAWLVIGAGRVAVVSYSIVSAVLAGELSWLAVYELIGETPAVLAPVPVAAAAAGAAAIVVAYRRSC